jgi:uncharacterized membrane protein YcjF (UPF0283 family)
MSWRDDPYRERVYRERREQLLRAGYDPEVASDNALARAQQEYREEGRLWRIIVRVLFFLFVAYIAYVAVIWTSSLFESYLVRLLIVIPVIIAVFGLALNIRRWFRLKTGRR